MNRKNLFLKKGKKKSSDKQYIDNWVTIFIEFNSALANTHSKKVKKNINKSKIENEFTK